MLFRSVFTPKSLLRAKYAVSSREDFTSGTFQPLLFDDDHRGSEITRLLLCSGKVYYDLAAEREAGGHQGTAIIRFERLYPLPSQLQSLVREYPNAEVRWVQEEPENQGAWGFMSAHLREIFKGEVDVVARPASSAPAVGTLHRHATEQGDLVHRAFR